LGFREGFFYLVSLKDTSDGILQPLFVAYYSLIYPVLSLSLPLRLLWLDPRLPWLALRLPWLAVLCALQMARLVYGKDPQAHQKDQKVR